MYSYCQNVGLDVWPHEDACVKRVMSFAKRVMSFAKWVISFAKRVIPSANKVACLLPKEPYSLAERVIFCPKERCKESSRLPSSLTALRCVRQKKKSRMSPGTKPLSSAKNNHVSCQKRYVFCQKIHMSSARRALWAAERVVSSAKRVMGLPTKEPYSLRKESYLVPKKPCLWPKEPCLRKRALHSAPKSRVLYKKGNMSAAKKRLPQKKTLSLTHTPCLCDFARRAEYRALFRR